MSDLKPCPFCGAELTRHQPKNKNLRPYWHHPENGCCLSDICLHDIHNWNNRDNDPDVVQECIDRLAENIFWHDTDEDVDLAMLHQAIDLELYTLKAELRNESDGREASECSALLCALLSVGKLNNLEQPNLHIFDTGATYLYDGIKIVSRWNTLDQFVSECIA